MTDIDRFRELVRAMRQEQKDYFKTRKPEHLYRSKELEKAVDKELEGRPSLFEPGS